MSEAVAKDLPNNWRWKNLRNLGEWSGGGTPSKSNPKFWDQKDIPWVSPKDMKVKNISMSQDYISKFALENTNLRLLPKCSLLMVTRSGILAHSFPVAINDVPVTVNQDLKALVLSNDLNDKYVYYALKRYEREILKECSKHGTTVHSIEMPKLMRFQLPIAPPEQQKPIVAKIEELFSHIDAGIEALKKAKQLLKQYRQSVLKAAVTGELTKEWREQNNLSIESWQESTIGEIAKVQTGKTPKRSTEEYWKNGAIPWLTSSATNEAFTHHADQFVTQAAVDDGLKLFEPGTLLLAMYGEGKTRGQVTEITFQATCNQACAAIIVDEEKAIRAFVRLRLNENYEQTRKAASGGNQPNLNLSKVREISLPLPSLAEQSEIVSQVELKFEAINRLENELGTQLFKAEKNKQSILASAFSGVLHG